VLIARAAPEQWGVFTLAELLDLGLSKEGVLRRERAGRLHRLHRAIYAVGYRADVPETRLLAAVKAGGDRAVLSHLAAAWLWGFLAGDEPRPEITIPGPGARAIDGILIHRSLILEPRDRTRHRRVPITTAARTVIDLAAVLDESVVRQAVRRAQGLRRLSLKMLLRTADRVGPRRGSATLRRIIATGPAPTNTVIEDVVLDLLLSAGFEHPDVNRPLMLAGRRVVPDFRWPRERLVIEADGAAWHDEKIAREDDAERQALLEAHGERVLRLTWAQVSGQPGATVARVAAAGAPRGLPQRTRLG
jgi:very-short-patch-repair endonuclease